MAINISRTREKERDIFVSKMCNMFAHEFSPLIPSNHVELHNYLWS